MRIHSDTLTRNDFHQARNTATDITGGSVYVDTLTEHGSRSRARAWNVKLTGDGTLSKRRVNAGTARYAARGRDAEYAATYDQWGWFLAHLFTVDPRAVAGPYRDAADFHQQTRDAYARNLTSA